MKFLFAGFAMPIPDAPRRPKPAHWSGDNLTAAWIGHSTVLINFFGTTILTDPVFACRIGVRLGPFTIGPKRRIKPALTIDELPKLDVVLITHAHMDHLDLWSLARIDRNVTVITPRAVSDLLHGLNFREMIELDWAQPASIASERGPLRVEGLRVEHWGARLRHDDHRGYNGYLVERGSRRICFAGDTAFTGAFGPVGKRGGVDLMVVPIGAYDPWIASHCNPEQAVEMANMAKANYIMPVHHQTFRLSREPMDEPIARFRAALAASPERIAITQVGDTFVLPQ